MTTHLGSASATLTEEKTVTEVMRDIVESRFREMDDQPLETTEVYKAVAAAKPATPLELSRALLDLMDERVVKWDGAFRLVPPTATGAKAHG